MHSCEQLQLGVDTAFQAVGGRYPQFRLNGLGWWLKKPEEVAVVGEMFKRVKCLAHSDVRVLPLCARWVALFGELRFLIGKCAIHLPKLM